MDGPFSGLLVDGRSLYLSFINRGKRAAPTSSPRTSGPARWRARVLLRPLVGPEPDRHSFVAPFGTFDAIDGSFAICAGNNKLFAAPCAAIGRPELAGRPQYLTNADRMANGDALKAELEAALARRPVVHWLGVLRDAGVLAALILDVSATSAQEVLDSEASGVGRCPSRRGCDGLVADRSGSR